jgi:Protein of unknown function (DUF2380)
MRRDDDNDGDTPMRRRQCIGAAAALVSMAATVRGQGAPATAARLRTLTVLDVELIDDQDNPATKAAQAVRLRNATAQLRQELAERGLYRVVDPAPTRALQDTLRAQQEFFYRCDDCADQVGRQLGVELVMTPWVQKVSELILNVNVQIYDVTARQPIFTKSVDMRGNDDVSWQRAVRFLVRDMQEKRAVRPGYGQ